MSPTTSSSDKCHMPARLAPSSNNYPTKPIPVPRSEVRKPSSASQSSPSSSGMTFVQTPCGGWIVLKDAGQDQAEQDTREEELWDLLSVDEHGFALAGAEIERMRWDFMDDIGDGW